MFDLYADLLISSREWNDKHLIGYTPECWIPLSGVLRNVDLACMAVFVFVMRYLVPGGMHLIRDPLTITSNLARQRQTNPKFAWDVPSFTLQFIKKKLSISFLLEYIFIILSFPKRSKVYDGARSRQLGFFFLSAFVKMDQEESLSLHWLVVR